MPNYNNLYSSAVSWMFLLWSTRRAAHSFVVVQQQQHRRPATTAWRRYAATSTDTEWSTDKVRSTFIEYFEKSHEHTFQPSSACAPLNDPTLLFTNAGMNQFKPIFLGQADPNSALSQLQRAVNSQKCIRAGGKHNDLEDVGRDTYHHTFFEMLGTWSFGDYFKKEAIDFAWDLLVNTYKLDPDRMYATYFEGNDQVPADTEARDFWLQYLPAHKVIPCDAKDNFWEMGDVGPCGPCSEIHYDRIGGRNAADLVNQDDPNVIEIWNIVFIQFNREGPADLASLPQKHIDTGMGLERLVSILQDKSSNYDIDCFQPLFEKLASMTPAGPYTGKLGADDVDLKDTAYRAIADHARTLSFAIADGAIPNNEGRGYVLRRILRRAARYGKQILQCQPGFMTQLVPVVVETFGGHFPELIQQQSTIEQVVAEEEAAFSTMLERGIKYFDELQSNLEAEGQTVVPGSQAFYLYDTLGFPVDLTELMAEESGMTVDTDGFAAEMNTQKERSRQAQKMARKTGDSAADLGELQAEETAWLADQGILPTDDGFKYKWDVELPATVMAVYTANGFVKDSDDAVESGEYVGLVLDKSAFYAEAGGQETDTGVLELMDQDGNVKGRFQVDDVQVYAGFLLHQGVLLLDDKDAKLSVGSQVNCKVDYERRRLIAPNHSMTHVLNAALREVLGDSCDQRGSLCNDEKLRFDFSYKKALNLEQLEAIEEYCQQSVASAQTVDSAVMPLEEAKKINGVRAVFGEVYPDPVRVISIGDDVSVEFCGGTHLTNTAEAEAFCLIEESAVAKGIRRITAVTKEAAQQAQAAGAQFVARVEQAEGLDAATTADLDKQAGAIRKELDATVLSAALKATLRNRLEGVQKKATEAKKKALQKRLDTVMVTVEQQIKDAVAADTSALVLNVDIEADSKASQRVLNTVKKLAPDMAFLGLSQESSDEGKVLAFAYVPEALQAGLPADAWVCETLAPCGGRGGGKPGNAQGQAKECDDVAALETAAQDFAASQLAGSVA